MKKTNFYLKILLLAVSIAGCKKFLEINPPKNQLVDSAVFADSVNANSALLGIYIRMMENYGGAFASGALTLLNGLSSDELYATTSSSDYKEFYANQISPANSFNYSLWMTAYSLIYQTNASIEGITKSSGIASATKEKMIAEAKIIRSFCYFNLINLYGAVPLITSTEYKINRTAKRSETGDIYAFMEADLQEAKSKLQTANVKAERAGYYSCLALMSKIFLYQEKYEAAKNTASEIINSGNFTLETDLNVVFLSKSKEVIWTVVPVFPGLGTWEAFYFVPGSATSQPNYTLSDALYKSFESGDNRKSQWVGTSVVSGKEYHFPYKYKQPRLGSNQPENHVLFRLGEQYLIKAEAEANLNELSAAVADLNIVRNRAGLVDFASNSQAEVLSAIEKERRAELFCEGGNRWFDLKRTNRITDVLYAEKPNWRDYARLYPIPQSELNANSHLSQNPGY